MNDSLSRIVAELFEKPQGGEEPSSKINRLRDELKRVIAEENSIFGKLRELVESFREIIPEEKQRYTAAIKALSTTSKLSRQEIVAAVNNQLEELKILEKGLMPALPDWRDELQVMEAKAQELRGEIAKLRERITWLESEEKGIRKGMAARQKDVEFAEKAMKELFADIGAEIAAIKKKVEECSVESAAPRPVPLREPVKSDVPGETQGGGEQKSDVSEPAAPQALDSEWQKKCPMCGGRMNFHSTEQMWLCYSCAYEELTTNKEES